LSLTLFRNYGRICPSKPHPLPPLRNRREGKLQPHFRWIGFESNVRNLFSLSEALVHPSHSEGFGLAILEAMAAGLLSRTRQAAGGLKPTPISISGPS